MTLNLEQTINDILARRGYVLKYVETFPSSNEDMYEFKCWFEDNQLNKYPFHTFFIRNVENDPKPNYKRKALKMLLNIIIEGYFDIECSKVKKEDSNDIENSEI